MRIHSFFNRHPAAGVIPLFLTFYAVISLIGGTIDGILLVTKILPMGIATSIVSVISMFAYKKYFSPEFGGFLQKSGIPEGFVYLFPVIAETAYIVTSCGVRPGDLTISAVFLSLYAGLNEEFLYRGVVCSFLMRENRREGKILFIAFGSALNFGLVHLTNIIMGVPLINILLQAFNAFAIGVLLAAVYLRTGSLLPTIVMHTIYDLACFAVTGTESLGLEKEAVAGFRDFLETGIMAVIYIGVALFVMRKSARQEILARWGEIWHPIPDPPVQQYGWYAARPLYGQPYAPYNGYAGYPQQPGGQGYVPYNGYAGYPQQPGGQGYAPYNGYAGYPQQPGGQGYAPYNGYAGYPQQPGGQENAPYRQPAEAPSAPCPDDGFFQQPVPPAENE